MSKVFTPILLIIISLGLFFSYLSPALGALKKYQHLKETLDDSVNKYETLFEKLKTVEEKNQAVLSAHDKSVRQILPDEVDPIRLIIDIENILSERDLTVQAYTLPSRKTSVRLEDEYDKNSIQSKTMSVELTGEYDDFKTFIKTLESSKTLIDVTGIGIEKRKNEAGSGYTLVYVVFMKLYWLS